MKNNRLLAATLAGVVLMPGLVACHGEDVTYVPAAYGVPGHCYYAYSPDEVGYLYAAHLCPAGWVATPMPVWWHERYYRYYASPAYYTHYVPVRVRTVYVTSQRTFYRTYRVQIVQQSRYATYKGSNGRTVSGAKAGRRFGAGPSSAGGQRPGTRPTRGGFGNRGGVKQTKASTGKGSTSSGSGSTSKGSRR
ncbi:hypothetical protein [Actinoallomurus sp. NPDC052274]|uniref:hypothetical protein n=1 Tax=Actinoallomurus sp. NPDC052274 TaxID=3155420 RepID=UPI0034491AF0